MCGVKTEKNFPKKKNKHLLTYILLECNKIKSFTKKKISSAAFLQKKQQQQLWHNACVTSIHTLKCAFRKKNNKLFHYFIKAKFHFYKLGSMRKHFAKNSYSFYSQKNPSEKSNVNIHKLKEPLFFFSKKITSKILKNVPLY